MSERASGERRPPQPVSRSARTNGIRLCYLDWFGPAPAAAAVVLLHGVLQTKEGMANLAAHLARHRRVIVPDLRGRGDSDQPAEGYDPGTMAADVAGLIEALELGAAVVIGRLHGGLVAYHLAARRPDLVSGLVLGDTSPEVDARRAARALALIRALPPRFATKDEAVAFYQERLGLSEARALHDIPHDLVEADEGWLRWRHNLALVERIEAAAMPRADWDALAGVRCPTLVLRGQRGEVPVESAARICEMIATCEVQTIIGAGHDVFLGPGCEQTFGAIDLFLMRLGEDDSTAAAARSEGRMETPVASGAQVVARLVEAINRGDAEAVAALFAADARIVSYSEGGKVREGGADLARAVYGRVIAAGAGLEARDLVLADDRAACVLALRGVGRQDVAGLGVPPMALLAPTFLRLRDGLIVDLTTYHLHVPAGRE